MLKHTTTLAIFAMLIPVASAATRNVPADYPTIQMAIQASHNGDTVLVAPGTYVETINFLGKAITVMSSGGATVTTIDGNQAGSVVTFGSSESETSVLEGFTITNGSGTDLGSMHESAGGGVFARFSSATIRNNIFTHNTLNSGYITHGGAIYFEASFGSQIVGNTFTQNEATEGGVIYGTQCRFDATGNVFDDNQGFEGGVIDAFHVTITLRGNTITNNHSYNFGVMYADDCTLTMEDNLVSGNAAFNVIGGILVNGWGTISRNTFEGNTGGSPSAIFAMSFLTLENNVIRGNLSEPSHPGVVDAVWAQSGDGYFLNIFNNIFDANTDGAALRTKFCRVIGNTITGNGSGVVSESRDLLQRNLITDNLGAGVTATDKATIESNLILRNADSGIDCTSPLGGQSTIRNNTILGNTAVDFGGGISIGTGASPVIQNNIVRDNAAASGDPEIHASSGSQPDISYCDVKGGWPGTGNIDADPQFVAVDDYRLLPGSPCIEAGNPTDKPTGRDFFDNPRGLDANLDHKITVDIGAFEYDNVHLSVTGSTSPGGTLTLETTGLDGLSVLLLVGTKAGEAPLRPYGNLFLDFSSPWFLLDWGMIPSTVIAPIDASVPTPLPLVLQEIALDAVLTAGNSSNVVELTIQ